MTTAIQSASLLSNPERVIPAAAPVPVPAPSQVQSPIPRRGLPGVVGDFPGSQARRRSRAAIVLPVLTATALGAATVAWVAGRGKETTDDAQVEGHVVSVAPRVAGQVERVLVKDNQSVKEGDVLVELDGRDYEARLASARADLAAARAELHAAQ